jgi:hypothetical protein
MKLLAFLALVIVLATWWECQRTADRFHVCRGVGHGAAYFVAGEILK